MFEIGDLIIYGNTGVCKVVDITEMEIKSLGVKNLYYVLESVYKNCKISTPVNNKKVIMRPILTKNEAIQLIDHIPELDVEPYEGKGFRQISEHYESVIKTCDAGNLIEMTMSIHQKKNGNNDDGVKYGATDDHFMKIAEDLLFGELAASLDIDKTEVSSFIKNRIETVEEGA